MGGVCHNKIKVLSVFVVIIKSSSTTHYVVGNINHLSVHWTAHISTIQKVHYRPIKTLCIHSKIFSLWGYFTQQQCSQKQVFPLCFKSFMFTGQYFQNNPNLHIRENGQNCTITYARQVFGTFTLLVNSICNTVS